MILVILLVICCFDTTSTYCIPSQDCWPAAPLWQTFGDGLNGKLTPLQTTNYQKCVEQGDNAFNISATAEGMCMQYHDCSKKFCNATNTEWTVPAYSVEAKNVNDVIKTFEFANQHNILVTVKTSGHSYSGSSMGKDSILIWMYSFTKYLDIKENYKDSCEEKVHSTVIKVGGGQTWGEVYGKLKSDYHIVGGGGLTVSAAGGWLQGCGLSAMSRKYGIGIDNVIDFEVVLTNGTLVKADACSNTDLFWALRGGGGGSFGVVTSIHYKLHTVEPVTSAFLNIEYSEVNVKNFTRAVIEWINFWTDKSPHLDNRWGGYWTLSSGIIYFVGNKADAMTTFGNDVVAFKDNLPDELKSIFQLSMEQHNSYYDARGAENMTTDLTGFEEFNIGSRLIPRELVVKDPAKAKDALKWLVNNGFSTFNYFLGGVMSNVSRDSTAVHPAMRQAVWQIETFNERMLQKLRAAVPDTGAGFNHASKIEPDWRKAFWGSNLERLEPLKKKYDPDNRLNCWHCVGYQGDEPEYAKNPFIEEKKDSAASVIYPSIALSVIIMILHLFKTFDRLYC